MPRRRRTDNKDMNSGTQNTTTETRSELAKEHNISAVEEESISDAFALYAARAPHDPERDNHLAVADVRRCLAALDLAPSDRAEQRAIVEAVDPEGVGFVPYERFVAVAALKLHSRVDRTSGKRRVQDDDDDEDSEAAIAYSLFTKGEERQIGLNDLRRIAKELREDVSDDLLKDMLREATGGEVRGVSMEEFEGVMKRAGVIK